MKRLWLGLVLLLPLAVSGCNLFGSGSGVYVYDPYVDVRDLTGTWNLILHMEAIENELLPITLVIRDMSCAQGACQLSGYLEVESFSKMQRYSLKKSYYYPGQELVRLNYDYETIKNESREAIIIFDTFPTGNVPQDAMAGHIVVYDVRASSVYLTPEDLSILQETRKGKTASAGQVTAWKVIVK